MPNASAIGWKESNWKISHGVMPSTYHNTKKVGIGKMNKVINPKM
jgi:hypothetical protein